MACGCLKFQVVQDRDLQFAEVRVLIAMGVVRRAYQDLVTAATPQTPAAAAAAHGKAGKVPQYLANQLANLNAGLQRLSSGSPFSTTI